MTALAIAAAVRAGERSAVSVAQQAIAAIKARDGDIHAVTRLLEERALAEARAVDEAVVAGRDPGPLAGVPYGVKDLFDVAGLPTTAGAGMRCDAPPAKADAEAILRLRAAGAVLVATLNMDEFAYGFATVNAAYGTTRNPRDTARLAGGSSGGSAAAVAAGMLPLTLGSDTNGSIRVPAALCGIYGLRPTQGGMPMGGVFPFVDSFDTIGPFAATIADLAAAWRALGGIGAANGSPRVARLSGWFDQTLDAEAAAAIGGPFAGLERVELAEVDRARSAAFLMTAREGGLRHLSDLRTRALEFDPATRDRFIAGALLPEDAYRAAQAFQQEFCAQALRLFDTHDILIAPCIGEVAPRADDPFITIGGQRVPARAHLGLLTQPLNLIGLPVIAAPLRRPGKLPLGIQIIGRPGGEADLFAYAAGLEAQGITGAAQAD
jgi:aspartyl-tRNA(Asn)/glutamyl-tRNA(Gln) amidotransferase subunit A